MSMTVPFDGVYSDSFMGRGKDVPICISAAALSRASTLAHAPAVSAERTVAATQFREVSSHFSHRLSSNGAALWFARRRSFSTSEGVSSPWTICSM